MQITIDEIRHFTLMTELLMFTITLHFFASLFGGTLVYHGIIVTYYRSPCPGIFWGTASRKKYLEERRSPAFRVPH